MDARPCILSRERLRRKREEITMKILRKFIFLASIIVGLSITASAQKNDPKKPPPKERPPVVTPQPKNPPPKDDDKKPKKPSYILVAMKVE
jgi:hypothetical protein